MIGLWWPLTIVTARTKVEYRAVDSMVNPHLMGKSVGLSPMVTLVSVSVVGLLFGGFAVVLAIPVTSAVATLIDVLVLDHEPPPEPAAANGAGRR